MLPVVFHTCPSSGWWSFPLFLICWVCFNAQRRLFLTCNFFLHLLGWSMIFFFWSDNIGRLHWLIWILNQSGIPLINLNLLWCVIHFIYSLNLILLKFVLFVVLASMFMRNIDLQFSYNVFVQDNILALYWIGQKFIQLFSIPTEKLKLLASPV